MRSVAGRGCDDRARAIPRSELDAGYRGRFVADGTGKQGGTVPQNTLKRCEVNQRVDEIPAEMTRMRSVEHAGATG